MVMVVRWKSRGRGGRKFAYYLRFEAQMSVGYQILDNSTPKHGKIAKAGLVRLAVACAQVWLQNGLSRRCRVFDDNKH